MCLNALKTEENSGKKNGVCAHLFFFFFIGRLLLCGKDEDEKKRKQQMRERRTESGFLFVFFG